jgi:hypothetical protein
MRLWKVPSLQWRDLDPSLLWSQRFLTPTCQGHQMNERTNLLSLLLLTGYELLEEYIESEYSSRIVCHLASHDNQFPISNNQLQYQGEVLSKTLI